MSSDDAFKQLFTDHHQTLVRFAAYRVGDSELAQDIAADVFRIAWEKHQAGVVITTSWLFTTARNRIGNEYQRRKRDLERQASLVVEMVIAADEVEAESRDDELREAMARLKAPERLVLQLTYWDGLNANEAASFLGCTVPALWVRLSRARASLRTLLATSPVDASRLRQVGGESSG